MSAAAVMMFVIGDLPTLYQLWEANQRSISFWEVGESDKQQSAWKRNVDCYGHANTVGEDGPVAIIICPSGDVLVNFETASGPIPYWVVHPQPVRQLSMSAAAQSTNATPQTGPATEGNDAAQGISFEVICQRFVNDAQLLRRLHYPNGQCVDQILDVYSNRLIQQTPTECGVVC